MKPAFRISISGLDGFVRWPLVDSVAHVEPVDDVVLRGLPSSNCVVDIFHGDTWVTSVSVVVDGSMVLPSHLFEDAITNRLRLVLSIDGEVYGGYIIFLPLIESEPFDIADTYLNADGTSSRSTAYIATDYIDISFVDDIIYNGRIIYTGRIAMAGYDQEHNFVKILLDYVNNASEAKHIVPDGSYNYIRASSVNNVNYSLQIHYRSRRRR